MIDRLLGEHSKYLRQIQKDLCSLKSGEQVETTTIAGTVNNTTVTIAGVAGKRIHVYYYILTTTSTTALTITAASNGVGKFDCILQSPTDIVSGANESINPPASLFTGEEGYSVVFTSSGAGVLHYTISYWIE